MEDLTLNTVSDGLVAMLNFSLTTGFTQFLPFDGCRWLPSSSSRWSCALQFFRVSKYPDCLSVLLFRSLSEAEASSQEISASQELSLWPLRRLRTCAFFGVHFTVILFLATGANANECLGSSNSNWDYFFFVVETMFAIGYGSPRYLGKICTRVV